MIWTSDLLYKHDALIRNIGQVYPVITILLMIDNNVIKHHWQLHNHLKGKVVNYSTTLWFEFCEEQKLLAHNEV